MTKFIFIIVVAGAMSACNYTRFKDSRELETFGPLSNSEKLSMMNFQFIYSRTIEPRCVSCHDSSEKVNLTSYENVRANLEKIKQTVFVDRTMPKKGKLASDERRLLWHWLEMGAPENSDGPPPPDLEPLIATYDSINKHIFQKTCVDCHSPGNSGKSVLLDKESLLNSPLELVIPGNPDESGLVIAVERTDDKRMPTAKEGYSALKDEEKAAIRKWIENNAKD